MFIMMYMVVCLVFAGIIVYVVIKYGNNDKEDK